MSIGMELRTFRFKSSEVQSLRRRPRNVSGPCIAMFFLHIHPPMRRNVTAGLIHKSDKGKSGGERVEDDLSVFTTPDLDDVWEHAVVFIVPLTDGDMHPCDGDLISTAYSAQHS